MKKSLFTVLLLLLCTVWVYAEPAQGARSSAEEELDRSKKIVKERAERILAKKPCKATENDFQEAGKVCADAFRIGDEGLADRLLAWIRMTFRCLVAEDKEGILEPTVLEKWYEKFISGEALLEDWLKMSPEERREAYTKTKDVVLPKRARLAAQAQLLGFEELAELILERCYIQSPCIQHWDINVTVNYKGKRGNGDSWIESWRSEITIKGVPLYLWDPELGHSPLFGFYTAKGNLTKADFSYFDSDKGRVRGKPQRFPKWHFEMMQLIENREDYKIKNEKEYKDKPIAIAFCPFPFDCEALAVKYPDFPEEVSHIYEGNIVIGARADGIRGLTKELKIPFEKLKERKTFSIKITKEEKLDIGFDKAEVSFKFIPTKREGKCCQSEW